MNTNAMKEIKEERDRIHKNRSEIIAELDLSPEGIEATASNALYTGLCQIRLLSRHHPKMVFRLADAMHNLPNALHKKDYESIRQFTIEAVLAQKDIEKEMASEHA